MVVDKIDTVKDLIDFLAYEKRKMEYKSLREDGLTPIKIKNNYIWKDSLNSLTLQDYYTYDSTREELIEEWLQTACEDNRVVDVTCGAEQIVVIFEDIVYKFSNSDVGSMVNNFIDQLDKDELKDLFAYYNYIETYKECAIYSQKRATMDTYSKDIESSGHTIHTIDDEMLSDAIWFQLGNEDLFNELNDCLDQWWGIDIHSENWGYTEDGRILIFDPIYTQ